MESNQNEILSAAATIVVTAKYLCIIHQSIMVLQEIDGSLLWKINFNYSAGKDYMVLETKKGIERKP